MASSYHTLAFYQGGSPKTGLSPIMEFVFNLETRAAVTNFAAFTITEMGQGMYQLVIDWDNSTLSSINRVALRLNGDPTSAEGMTDLEKYQFFETGRADTVYMEDFYDALTGDWEVVSNQLIMKDREGVTLHTFNLFDSSGSPTSINPAKRERV